MTVDFSNNKLSIYNEEEKRNLVVTLDTEHVYSMYEVGYLVSDYLRMLSISNTASRNEYIYRSMLFDISYRRRSVGKAIEIYDFNFDPWTCASGFHFFDSMYDAVMYIVRQ